MGEYWKETGENPLRYVGEEHIGAISTAPLNSKGLHPDVYEHPIEIRPRVPKVPTPAVLPSLLDLLLPTGKRLIYRAPTVKQGEAEPSTKRARLE